MTRIETAQERPATDAEDDVRSGSFGSSERIAVLGGDGIGPEVTAEAMKVLDAAATRFGLEIERVDLPWGAEHYLSTGETLPEGALERLRDEFGAIYVGAFGDPRVPDNRHARDILLGLRFGLDLYVNFRPIELFDERLCPLRGKGAADVDFVVFRENTEGAYVDMGGNFKRGTPDEIAIQEEVYTRKGVERIVRAAFAWADANGRSRVTLCDKSNVLRYGHDLWRRCFAEVAAEYPDLEHDALYVDAAAMLMVREPERFDVIVTENMFGDILSDLGAALQGGLGIAASANLHPQGTSLFEPVHGSAPDRVGKGIANPVAAVLTVALLLDHLGSRREQPADRDAYRDAAAAVRTAVRGALAADQTTPDIGGSLSTVAVGDELAARVAAHTPQPFAAVGA